MWGGSEAQFFTLPSRPAQASVAQKARPQPPPDCICLLAGHMVAFRQSSPIGQLSYELPKGRDIISSSSVPLTCPAHARRRNCWENVQGSLRPHSLEHMGPSPWVTG